MVHVLTKTCSFTHIKNTVRGNNFNSQLKCNNFLKSSITSQKCSNQNIPKPNSSASLPQNFINKVRASWTRDKKFTPQSNLLQNYKIGKKDTIFTQTQIFSHTPIIQLSHTPECR